MMGNPLEYIIECRTLYNDGIISLPKNAPSVLPSDYKLKK